MVKTVLILTAFACLLHAGLNLLLMLGWLRVRRRKEAKTTTGALPGITVLIAARNEAHNLQQHLPAILKQDYPQFEVLVVLNQTRDHSVGVLAQLKKTHSHLRWIDLEEVPADWAPKKWAIEQGVRGAQFEHLALTDADCRPESGWLKGMGERFAQGYEVVLGLGMYQRYGGWLQQFIQYETWYTAWQYIGAAAWGRPYMGVGRNLGYTRNFFLRNGGLERWKASLSGDDDLLIGAYGPSARTTEMIKSGTWTWSEPPKGWAEWWRQKTRHVSASSHYSLINRGVLGVFHLSQLGIHLGILTGLLIQATAWPLWGLYICTIVVKWGAFGILPKEEGVRTLHTYFPGLEITHFLYNLSVVPIGLIKRPEWKNRIPEYQKTRKRIDNL